MEAAQDKSTYLNSLIFLSILILSSILCQGSLSISASLSSGFSQLTKNHTDKFSLIHCDRQFSIILCFITL